MLELLPTLFNSVSPGPSEHEGPRLVSRNDHIGNIAVVDESGAVVAAYEYAPFGNIVALSGSEADEVPFRFSTKYFDSETGLYYYGYRFYAPLLGRWINRDPIGVIGGENLLLFLNNSPTVYYDKLGMSCVKVISGGKEVTSAEDFSIEISDISGWGRFDFRQFTIRYRGVLDSCCSIELNPRILISKVLQGRHSHQKGELSGYIKHFVRDSRMKGGISQNPLFESVVAHEKGHGKAFLEYDLPKIQSKIHQFCGASFFTAASKRRLKNEIQTVIDEVTSEEASLSLSATYANDETLAYFTSHSYKSLTPPYYVEQEMEPISQSGMKDYVWEKE